MPKMGQAVSRMLIIVAALLGASQACQAQGKLSPETCSTLRTQSAAMEAAGIKKDLEKGAAWARQNLSQDRIKQVMSYISVTEQILFRCPRPAPTEAEGDGATAGVAQTGPAKPKKAMRIPPLPVRKPSLG